MKVLLLVLALVSSLIEASILPDVEVGKKFHRAKANSPVCLEFSTGIDVSPNMIGARGKFILENYPWMCYGKTGFKIKTVKDDQEIGYVTLDFVRLDGTLSIGWLYINERERRKGYAEHAMLTVEGVIRKKRNDVRNLLVQTNESNVAMKALLAKFGYLLTGVDGENRIFTKALV